MKTAIILILFSLLNLFTLAQSKLGNEWITGSGGQQIKFNGNSITTSNALFFPTYFHGGNSNICDTNGNLILCSDGFTIYDSNANIIDGGDTLVNIDYYNHFSGWSLYPQTSIFLPMDSGIYYFITPCNSAGNLCYGCPFDIIMYNVIDMNANGGAGKVIKRMQTFAANGAFSRTQMMACRHSNGKDWWLLKQKGGDSNVVYKFLFTQDSVYDKGLQKFDAPIWGAWDIKGQSMFSKDGSKYASTCQSIGTGEVFVADFDRCYGILSNPQVITIPNGSMHNPNDSTATDRLPFGLTFSPNHKFLYVMSACNVWQYDCVDLSWYHVAGLDTVWLKFQNYSNSYIGPDDRIYIGNFGGTSKQMSVINNPDVKGIGCNFCPRCLRMDTLVVNGYASTPPCMPNYSLGSQTCWPLDTDDREIEVPKLEVYPNPASTRINIKTNIDGDRELYNSVGQLLLTTKRNEIDISGYCTGVYYIKIKNAVEKVIIE